MSSPSDMLTTKIVKDRLEHLIGLFQKHPPQDIWKIFKREYGIELSTTDDIKKAYDLWFEKRKYSRGYIITELERECPEAWSKIRTTIEKHTKEEIVDFIYEHWKKYEKQRKR